MPALPRPAPEPAPEPAPAMRISGLTVSIGDTASPIRLVSDVRIDLERGECLGVVGESGCGKTVTFMAALGLLPSAARVTGSVSLGEREILGLPEAGMEQIRGKRIAMISQDPQSALNPVRTIGRQLVEVIRLHRGFGRAQAHRTALELLALVGIPAPHERMNAYPHELSGGMCQRVMIAVALAPEPDILIADEPTTALDPTVQLQVLDLLRSIQGTRDLSIVFITHDLGVVAEICDRLVVMYAGRIAEVQPIPAIFARPRHPYTAALLECLPTLEYDGLPPISIPGEVPMPSKVPAGCPFHPRCGRATEVCRSELPPLTEVGAATGRVACHHPLLPVGEPGP